jgi:hypothetical protein
MYNNNGAITVTPYDRVSNSGGSRGGGGGGGSVGNASSLPVYENERGEMVVDEYAASSNLISSAMAATTLKKRSREEEGRSTGKSSSSGKTKHSIISKAPSYHGPNSYNALITAPQHYHQQHQPQPFLQQNTGGFNNHTNYEDTTVKTCYGCEQGWGLKLDGASISEFGGEGGHNDLWQQVDQIIDTNIMPCGVAHTVKEIHSEIQTRRLANQSVFGFGNNGPQTYKEFTRVDIIRHLDIHAVKPKWKLRRQLDRTDALIRRLYASGGTEGGGNMGGGMIQDYEDEETLLNPPAPLFTKEERESYIKLQEDFRKTLRDIQALNNKEDGKVVGGGGA